VFNRPDYNFRLDNAGTEPIGDEQVSISMRARGSALDLVVAEAMILANCTWGGWLDECGVPGIYRSQASMAPGVKVRMGTRPAPHAGMGVPQYAWCTSPLRRYVDLAAPFKPKDASLFSVISGFDAAYAAYNDFQNGIERFWTLRWLQQHEVAELDAMVMKDGLVRADTLPLVFRATGTESLPRGSHVRVRVGGIDLLTLEVHGSLVSRLDVAAAADTPEDNDATVEGDEDELNPGGLRLAIELDEAPANDAIAAPVAATD
jgi:exoribonuclease II